MIMEKEKDTTEMNSNEEQKKNKKTIDEKIQDLKSRLKSAEQQKKRCYREKEF